MRKHYYTIGQTVTIMIPQPVMDWDHAHTMDGTIVSHENYMMNGKPVYRVRLTDGMIVEEVGEDDVRARS